MNKLKEGGGVEDILRFMLVISNYDLAIIVRNNHRNIKKVS